MRTVFADTSFFIALLNPKDELHDKAQKLRNDLRPFHLLTSEMVLTEFLNDFAGRGDIFKQVATEFVEQLRIGSRMKPPFVSIISQTPEQFESAFATYKNRFDKYWGLTDCASFLAMKKLSITEVLTYDHPFEQMGFSALLRM